METQDKGLARLEEATARLVQVAKDLREERDRLLGRLSAAEQDTQELHRTVAALRGERETIRKRLEAMDTALSQALTVEPDAVPTKDAPSRPAKGAPASAVEELTLF